MSFPSLKDQQPPLVDTDIFAPDLNIKNTFVRVSFSDAKFMGGEY